MTVPAWIKITAALGVVWYGFGLLQFWLGFSMDTAAASGDGTITVAHAAAINGTPLVVWLAFALASLAGLIGAALLFTGNRQDRMAFAVSLVSAVLYYVWVYGLSGTGGDRPSEEIGIAAMVVGVTIAFNLISRSVVR